MFPFRKSILFLAFLIACVQSQAQLDADTSSYHSYRASGFFFMSGNSPSRFIEGYSYDPLLFGGYFHFPLTNTSKRRVLSTQIIPHAGFVPLPNKLTYEWGVNVFFDYSGMINKNTKISIIAGAGPHYITLKSIRQRTGFIFSDNFLVSIKRRMKTNNHWLEIGGYIGLRHISNASLRLPNKGINNYVVGFTISNLYHKKDQGGKRRIAPSKN